MVNVNEEMDEEVELPEQGGFGNGLCLDSECYLFISSVILVFLV